MPRQIRLTLNLQTTGRHDAAWKTVPDASTLVTDVDYYVRVARLAERGRLDAIFFADLPGSLHGTSMRRPWHGLDPTVLLSTIAAHTSAIGLISTVPAIHGSPFVTARQIASLDHVSKGRAAWNIITSQNAQILDALGTDTVLDSASRYRKAGEFVEIVTSLWESLPQEAIVDDRERDVYIDTSRTRPVEYRGDYYSTTAVLPVTGGHRGRPVLFQAGASERSREFGARWADALFAAQRTKALAHRFTSSVKGLAAARGRDPEKLVVLPGLWVIVGDTEKAAHDRKAELDAQLDAAVLLEQLAERLGIPSSRLVLDEELPYHELSEATDDPLVARHREQLVAEARGRLTVRRLLFNNVTGGHRVLIGTPEQIADDIVEWVDQGASDGFTLNIDRQPDGLEAVIDGPIAVLQQRGRFRSEYESDTLRENLGVA